MEFRAAMKYLHNIILTGLMIHFLPLGAENAQAGEYFETGSSSFMAEIEEALMTPLDEELSLLDEEFEEFREELTSIEEALQKKEPAQSVIAENASSEASQEGLVLMSEQLKAAKENSIVGDALAPALEASAEIAQIAEEQSIAGDTLEPVLEASAAMVQIAEENAIAADTLEPAFEASAEKTQLVNESFEASADEPIDPFAADLPFAETSPIASEITAEHVLTVLAEKDLKQDAVATLNIQGTSMIGELAPLNSDAFAVDIKQAFAGSPIIYSLLLAMSVFSVFIWLYSVLSIRSSARVSRSLLRNVQNKLNSNNFDEALSICGENNNLFCKMVLSGIQSRRHGLPVMIEAMKAEGKRSSVAFWQKIGLLNDVAIIAPMLGLLGTVLGMFYAFYDINRSIESVSTLFDGLGISVGTTVAGLIVAILALILHSTAKYRLVRWLAQVENEAQSVATLIDDRTSIL